MGSSRDDSPAIILNSYDHAESDMIVTFFTKHKGRITGIAKGAKRSKKRFVNKLELFSLLTLSYTESNTKSLAFINEAELHTSFINIRSQISLFNTASVIQEIVLNATGEREGDNTIFNLLLWALTSLNEKRAHLPILVTFLLLFFDYIGYRPHLDKCLSCNRDLFSGPKHYFNPRAGGIICGQCKKLDKTPLIPLSLGTVRLLNSILDQPLIKLHRLHFSHHALSQSLKILYEYSRQLLQREIHSWKIAVNS